MLNDVFEEGSEVGDRGGRDLVSIVREPVAKGASNVSVIRVQQDSCLIVAYKELALVKIRSYLA